MSVATAAWTGVAARVTRVAVIGGGTMGNGIAQVFAVSGVDQPTQGALAAVQGRQGRDGLHTEALSPPIAARYFRTPVTVDDKSDQSPVTIADREAETAMRHSMRGNCAVCRGALLPVWRERVLFLGMAVAISLWHFQLRTLCRLLSTNRCRR